MAGYSYGRDMDYYRLGKENESAIFARATEFTAFLTQMQTHGDVRHAFEMTEEVKQIYRNFTRLHTELIPYMQKYSRIACETGMPPVRHLVLKYMDDAQKEIDQLHCENDRLSDTLKSVHKGHQNNFVNMMLCVYAHCSKRVITDEQAGSLMLSLVNAWVQ